MKIKRIPPEQLDAPPRPKGALKDDTDFWEFHDANPHVYDELVELALQDLADGLKRGFKDYIAIVRWFSDRRNIRTAGSDGFEINDKFMSRYARLVVHHHPELLDQFERRNGKSVTGFDPRRVVS